jgi:hypothetical protein
MTELRPAPAAGFRNCCMLTGDFDESDIVLLARCPLEIVSANMSALEQEHATGDKSSEPTSGSKATVLLYLWKSIYD